MSKYLTIFFLSSFNLLHSTDQPRRPFNSCSAPLSYVRYPRPQKILKSDEQRKIVFYQNLLLARNGDETVSDMMVRKQKALDFFIQKLWNFKEDQSVHVKRYVPSAFFAKKE
jgi:hypothetical protein